jgi:thioredoxin reductase
MVKWLKLNGHAKDEYHANEIGAQMLEEGFFKAVSGDELEWKST